MTLLECRNITKRFERVVALDGVNLTLERGKIYGLLGRNGAGKTTLMKLINGLLTPSLGAVIFNGQPIGTESKKRIAYLPERTYLDKSMNVRRVLDFFLDFYEDFDEAKAQKLLADLDLDENMKISNMSKGMQEKLQLILVISRKADLYVLDEPLGGVDPATRDYILDTILKNYSENAAVLISTHMIADIERILDEVIFIESGRVLLQSAADTLREAEHGSIDEYFRRRFRC